MESTWHNIVGPNYESSPIPPTPFQVPDSAILECKTPVDLDGKDFYLPAKHDNWNNWTK